MAKKREVQTFHPLAMAKSLEAQNEAVGLLIAEVSSTANFANKCDLEMLRELIQKCGVAAEKARKAMWPDETED